MKIDLSKVIGIWECPECHFQTKWTYTDCIEGGTPFCTDCDCDMELQSNSGEYEGSLDEPNNCQDNPGANNLVEKAVEDVPAIENNPEDFVRMSVYSCIGTRVRYHKLPYDWEDKEDIRKEGEYKLEDGRIYSVEHMRITNNGTFVYLVEIFEIPFNYSRFEEVK